MVTSDWLFPEAVHSTETGSWGLPRGAWRCQVPPSGGTRRRPFMAQLCEDEGDILSEWILCRRLVPHGQDGFTTGHRGARRHDQGQLTLGLASEGQHAGPCQRLEGGGRHPEQNG